jgi:DNA-binding CsgD family transcriptional regulator/Tfp pilus assembly protein PilF
VQHAHEAIALPVDDRTLRQANTALGWSLFRQGKFREAEAPLTEATLLSRDHSDDLNVMVTRGVQAIIAAARGLPHDAELHAQQAENTSHRHSAGEHSNAWCFHFARGFVALRAAADDVAHAHLQRSLQLVRRGPMRLETVDVLTALAMVERQLGRIDVATLHVHEARAILDLCPDPGQLLVDPRTIKLPRRTSTSTGLSDREVEVLGLVGEGLTTSDIAHRLRLSPRTVDAHLRAIYRQINVKNRAAATRYAIAHQLTSPPAAPPQ